MDSIIQYITTKDELDLLLRKLADISQQLFTVKNQAKDLLSEQFSSELAAAILEHFRQNKLDIDNQQDFHTFVTQFEEFAQSLPIVSITLGISPTDKIAQKITQWIRSQLDTVHIIAFSTDTSLIAGATVGYRGLFKDFSIKKQLEDYFEKNTT